MYIRLEKIDHTRAKKSFYTLSLNRTLFGEWCVLREWGRIDGKAQRQWRNYVPDPETGMAELERLKKAKQRHGYAVIPEQLGLL